MDISFYFFFHYLPIRCVFPSLWCSTPEPELSCFNSTLTTFQRGLDLTKQLLIFTGVHGGKINYSICNTQTAMLGLMVHVRIDGALRMWHALIRFDWTSRCHLSSDSDPNIAKSPLMNGSRWHHHHFKQAIIEWLNNWKFNVSNNNYCPG